MSVRVAHLTSVHAPDDVRIFVKQCRSLAAAGYEVLLVAPGEVRRDVDGVRFVPVRRPRNRYERATRTAWAIYRSSTRQQPQIYHFHDPELIPIGLLLKLRGRRVIYDVHEDLPRDILSKRWLHPMVRRPISTLAAVAEFIAARLVDSTVTVTPTIARRFPPSKTVIVCNYPILEAAWPDASTVAYASRPATIAYVGGISEPRGAREMVAAMNRVSPRHSAQLVLAGRYEPRELEADLSQMPGWHRVLSAGWLETAQVAKLLSRARIGIVTLLPLVVYRDSYPTKMFEYMAAGLPIIASDFPLWRDIITSAGCGLLVDPSDPSAIASAIDHLLENPAEAEDMGARGRRAAQERHSWATESEKLLRLYERLVGRP